MAHMIDTPNAVATMPVAAAAGTPGWFADNNPLSITDLDADWHNMVQASVTVPVTDHGMALDKSNANQLAEVLSGVHGIVTDVRSDLATTGASTVSKRAASAVLNATVPGNYSQCNAGAFQTADGNYSQCNAGESQTAAGDYSQCNAGWDQTADGNYSQCNAGVDQTVPGNYSQCNAGSVQAAHGNYSQCNAGERQYNFGARASIIGGKYVENIDDDCVCGGYGTSAPANFGDGLTNKNVKWKLHDDTGNAEFAGDVSVGGKVNVNDKASIDGATGTINVNNKASIDGATGDIATSGKATVTGLVTATGGLKTVTPANASATWDTDHWVVTLNEVGGRINIDFAAHSLGVGDGVLLQITNSKIDAGSRVHYTIESQANIANGADGLPVVCPQGPSIPGGVVIQNLKGTLDTAATLAFDVINPA